MVEIAISRIGDIDRKKYFPGNFVTIRGRVIRIYLDISRYEAHLIVEDGKGRILIKVKKASSQTVMIGAIVNVRGALRLYEDRLFIESSNIFKLQPVGDEFSELAEIPVPKEEKI